MPANSSSISTITALIDNDTISVYHNKKLVLSKKRLTDRPLTIEIDLSEEDDMHELVMVAENLGESLPILRSWW